MQKSQQSKLSQVEEKELDVAYKAEHQLKFKLLEGEFFETTFENSAKALDIINEQLDAIAKTSGLSYQFERDALEKSTALSQSIDSAQPDYGYSVSSEQYRVDIKIENNQLTLTNTNWFEKLKVLDYFMNIKFKFVVAKNKDDNTVEFYLDPEIMERGEDSIPFALTHSDLIAGKPAIFSGYAWFDAKANLDCLTNESGHYKFDLQQSENFVEALIEDYQLQNMTLNDFSQKPGEAYYQIFFETQRKASEICQTNGMKNSISNDSNLLLCEIDNGNPYICPEIQSDGFKTKVSEGNSFKSGKVSCEDKVFRGMEHLQTSKRMRENATSLLLSCYQEMEATLREQHETLPQAEGFLSQEKQLNLRERLFIKQSKILYLIKSLKAMHSYTEKQLKGQPQKNGVGSTDKVKKRLPNTFSASKSPEMYSMFSRSTETFKRCKQLTTPVGLGTVCSQH